MLLHEDYPHTIPSRAYVRWKENYFWVFMDPASDVCCLAHCSAEPALERAFASFTILHGGRTLTDAHDVALPSPFEHQKELRYGDLMVRFLKPQESFRIEFENEDVAATLNFERRMHLFDFLACADVNPDRFSISENVGFERHAYRHQGQCLTGTGSVTFKTGDDAGRTIAVNGTGYRDHSWGFRNDALTLDHNWTFFNLPGMGGHFMRVRNSTRPEISTLEGYIARPEGNAVVRELEIETVGQGPAGMPDKVIYRAQAYDGARYTIVADVGRAFARLPLHSQKPGRKTYYNVENMCPCVCEETGETGFANVEIGTVVGE